MLCLFCMRDKGDLDVCPHCHNPGVPNAEPHHLLPGTVLRDRYTVGKVLGEGGFGITYLSFDKVFEITVAIKEYFPCGFSLRNNRLDQKVSAVSDSEGFDRGKQRFLQEAKTLVRFRKEPGIVEVTDFIEDNNTAYIVMEYLEGITLKNYLLQHGNMSPDQAFDLLTPVMGALEKIHRAGVIHRDISPDNIMYMADGTLKLMDFGAARDFDSDNKSLSVILKHGYAPEEQYRRRGEQGPWTDVYAICATIYRCITGEAPPDSADRMYADTMKAPSAMGVAISPALENVLLYGLAVRRDDRCPDMTTLLQLIAQARAYPAAQPQYPSNNPQYTRIDSNSQRKAAEKPARRAVYEAPAKPPRPPRDRQDRWSLTVYITMGIANLMLLIGFFWLLPQYGEIWGASPFNVLFFVSPVVYIGLSVLCFLTSSKKKPKRTVIMIWPCLLYMLFVAVLVGYEMVLDIYYSLYYYGWYPSGTMLIVSFIASLLIAGVLLTVFAVMYTKWVCSKRADRQIRPGRLIIIAAVVAALCVSWWFLIGESQYYSLIIKILPIWTMLIPVLIAYICIAFSLRSCRKQTTREIIK